MSSNSRIIEKDIFTSLIPAEAGDSEIIDLFGWQGGASRFSCQAIYDVSSPSAKTFASPHLASLVNQSLTYTSVDPGLTANDISITITAPSSGTHALAISTVGTAISVSLESSAVATATASLAVTAPITLTSVASGSARNTQTFTTQVLAAAANPTNTVLVTFSGTSAAIVCTVTPNDGTNNTGQPNAAATGVLDLTADITLTSVAAGTARNTSTFKTMVNVAAANPTDTVLVSFTGTSSAIVCTVTPNDGTNNGAVPVDLTTAELRELITTGAVVGKTVTITDASSFRILQTATGGGATNLANGGEGDNVTATFSGGTNLPVNITTAQLVELINTGAIVGKVITLTDASSFRILQTATGGGAQNLADGGEGDGVVGTFSGGANFNNAISTGNDVKSAINADGSASLLVLVSGTNASALTTLSLTNLAGGADGVIDTDLDTITIPSHGFVTELLIQVSSTGTLPSPLLTATDYYVIVIDENTIQLAASGADALAGIPIDLTTKGSNNAVGTITATALSGASVSFYGSNVGGSDSADWTLLQSATTISADGSVLFQQTVATYRYFKAVKDLSAGVLDLQAWFLAIGDAI